MAIPSCRVDRVDPGVRGRPGCNRWAGFRPLQPGLQTGSCRPSLPSDPGAETENTPSDQGTWKSTRIQLARSIRCGQNFTSVPYQTRESLAKHFQPFVCKFTGSRFFLLQNSEARLFLSHSHNFNSFQILQILCEIAEKKSWDQRLGPEGSSASTRFFWNLCSQEIFFFSFRVGGMKPRPLCTSNELCRVFWWIPQRRQVGYGAKQVQQTDQHGTLAV